LKRFLFIVWITSVFVACENQDDATQVVVKLQSGEYRQIAVSETKILYEVSCSSLSSKLSKFRIKSFDSEYGEISYLDSTINREKFNYAFIYHVPEFVRDTVEVTLKIYAEDLNYNSYELNLWVTVTGGAGLLSELSGIVIYSGSSRRANAFSLRTPSQPFLMALADSIDIDVYDLPNPINPETLSKEWHSNTDVRFVKANSFNYANATTTTVKATYASSVRNLYLSNIQTNDIILVGRNENAEAAIMITDVVDNSEIDNDFYRFNIKLIK